MLADKRPHLDFFWGGPNSLSHGSAAFAYKPKLVATSQVTILHQNIYEHSKIRSVPVQLLPIENSSDCCLVGKPIYQCLEHKHQQ